MVRLKVKTAQTKIVYRRGVRNTMFKELYAACTIKCM